MGISKRLWRLWPAARYFAGALALVLLGLVGLALWSPMYRVEMYSALQQDNRPVEPFQIAPGLYYVGASDIAVYALTTQDGIILIDSGYESTAQRVPGNLRKLGLDPASVRVILNTHAHVDHASGIAALKQQTGAKFYASPGDKDELESGGRGDFYLGNWVPYPPAHVDHVLHDGEVVQLGGRALTAHFTPGHTKGCTSWSFPIPVDGREVQALVICSVSLLGYRLVDNLDYPQIAADFSHSFGVLRALPCELFLGAHGKWGRLLDKMHVLAANDSPNPFIDPVGCRNFLALSEQHFRQVLAQQEAARKR